MLLVSAHFGEAASIIAMSHMDDRVWAVVFLCTFMGCTSASITGSQTNFVELAPNFAGPIFSVGNCAGSILGIVGPILVGFIVTEAVGQFLLTVMSLSSWLFIDEQ